MRGAHQPVFMKKSLIIIGCAEPRKLQQTQKTWTSIYFGIGLKTKLRPLKHRLVPLKQQPKITRVGNVMRNSRKIFGNLLNSSTNAKLMSRIRVIQIHAQLLKQLEAHLAVSAGERRRELTTKVRAARSRLNIILNNELFRMDIPSRTLPVDREHQRIQCPLLGILFRMA